MCRWSVLSLVLIQSMFMAAYVSADTLQKRYHVNIAAGTVAESLNQLSEQITVFDSSGIALQDLCVAKVVLDQAIENDMVVDVGF